MFDSKYKDFEYIKSIKNFNEPDKREYWTHFHYICRDNNSNLEVIKYCIENGADLNFNKIQNYTPFHCICREKQIKKC